jgi:hypothetical protein
MISRIEQLRDEIVSEFGDIKIVSGFRNDVKSVFILPMEIEKVTAFPALAVVIGKEEIEPKDQRWSVFDSFVRISVYGYVSTSTELPEEGAVAIGAESLIHDIKRVIADIMTKRVNDAENRWVVNPHRSPIEVFRVYDSSLNKAVVVVRFEVEVLSEGGEF